MHCSPRRRAARPAAALISTRHAPHAPWQRAARLPGLRAAVAKALHGCTARRLTRDAALCCRLTQDFNACLPLGPGRPLHGDGGPLLACRVRLLLRAAGTRDATAHLPRPQDTSTLAARANLQHRGAGDTRAFYVVQIELDMLTAPARPARHGDGGCSDSDDDDAPAEEAREPHAARRPPGSGMHGAPHAGGDARREASRGCDVRIGGGGVNEEAVTRVWMARRDARGAFLSCDAPTGDLKEWRSVFAAC